MLYSLDRPGQGPAHPLGSGTQHSGPRTTPGPAECGALLAGPQGALQGGALETTIQYVSGKSIVPEVSIFLFTVAFHGEKIQSKNPCDVSLIYFSVGPPCGVVVGGGRAGWPRSTRIQHSPAVAALPALGQLAWRHAGCLSDQRS